MYVALWLRLWGTVGTGDFNIAVLHASAVSPSWLCPMPPSIVRCEYVPENFEA
jgi:hypothetical protein